MEKIKVYIIIAVLVFVGIAAFVVISGLGDDSTKEDITNSADSGSTSAPLSGNVAVTIQGSSYSPNKLTVKKGATVTWTNRDSIEHDIVPDTESAGFKASELLKREESYSVTFNEVGTFTYHCTPHPFMTGTIEVVE